MLARTSVMIGVICGSGQRGLVVGPLGDEILVHAEGVHELRPGVVPLQTHQGDGLLVGAHVRTGQRQHGVRVGGVLVAVGGGHDGHAHAPHAGVHEGHVHFLALARALLLDVGGQHGHGQVGARGDVAEAEVRDHRAVALDGAVQVVAGARGVGGRVEAAAGSPLALGAVAGRVAADDLRVDLREALVVQAQLLGVLRTQVRQEHVAVLQHLLEDGQTFGLAGVQRDAALAGVDGVPAGLVAVVDVAGEADAAVAVAGGRLHLDDVGAPFAQDAAAHRSCHERGDLDDLHAFQKFQSHVFPPLSKGLSYGGRPVAPAPAGCGTGVPQRNLTGGAQCGFTRRARSNT